MALCVLLYSHTWTEQRGRRLPLEAALAQFLAVENIECVRKTLNLMLGATGLKAAIQKMLVSVRAVQLLERRSESGALRLQFHFDIDLSVCAAAYGLRCDFDASGLTVLLEVDGESSTLRVTPQISGALKINSKNIPLAFALLNAAFRIGSEWVALDGLLSGLSETTDENENEETEERDEGEAFREAVLGRIQEDLMLLHRRKATKG